MQPLAVVRRAPVTEPMQWPRELIAKANLVISLANGPFQINAI